MQNTKNYNIGLDIGVGSVGWCVTDSNSNIFKKGNKNMWGARIFEEANTAETTRNFRGNRRRINRRKERINILQSLMLEDIEKEYPNFLPMLRETSLVKQDKQISSSIDGRKYNLFSDNKMTDKEYYNKFKTIYDLRKYLIYTEEKVDIRLVYLAIHHIIKYRGNFLHEGDFSENTKEINENFQVILDYLRENYDIELIVEKEEFFEILQKKNMTKTAKKEKLITCFEFQKQDKTVITNIINSIVGSSFKLDKIFGSLELNEIKISFSSDIENEEEILTKLGEYSEIYEKR